MDSLLDGDQAILNIDKEGKRHCKYEHDRFTITKRHNVKLTRFTADGGSGFAMCSVGNIMIVNVAEAAQRCGLGTF